MLAADAMPLRRLWVSVLIIAARDADAAKPEVRLSAREYLSHRRLEIGSVRWICTVLDMDYERTRTFLCSASGRERLRRAMQKLETRDDALAKAA